MILAVAQPAPGPEAHVAAIRAARARVVVFPELSWTGYDLSAAPVSPADLGQVVEACAEMGSVALVGAICDGSIATLAVSERGAELVYRKMYLGGSEPFRAGAEPVALSVDGVRLGLAICKDTGVPAHAEATCALGIDVYVAGLVHHDFELEEQNRRGLAIAARGVWVAFASYAGSTGEGYTRCAGCSTLWRPDGSVAAQAGAGVGEVAAGSVHPVAA